MSPIEELVENVKGRLALGPEAGSLVQGLLRLIFGDPKGLKGFLDKFNATGLGEQASSWIGKVNNPPLAPQGAVHAFGEETIAGLASKVGLDNGVTTAALAYATPNIIGLLTQGGAIPTVPPAAVMTFLGSSSSPNKSGMFRPYQKVEEPVSTGKGEDTAGINRWIFPGVALLLAAAFIAHFWMNRAEPVAPAAPAASSAVAPAAPAAAALTPARLAIANDNGAITYSGVVSDETTRSQILDALKKAFGDRISGAISVEPNVAAAPWLAKLAAAFEPLKAQGAQAAFEGSAVSVGGSLAGADIDKILALLKPLFGTDFSFAHLPGGATGAPIDFSSLKDNFTGQDLTALLNHIVLNFETGSAIIDANGKAILLQAAALIKKLPPQSVVSISGYTDNTGDPGANVVLSQHRADAVRQTLVDAGVNPGGLTAKGYGSAASTTDGKSRADRRIEFSVSQ